MENVKNKISAPQLFCLVFCYVLAGLRLHGAKSIAATLFVCLFCVCVCVVCAAVCENFGSFSALSCAVMGKAGFVFRASGVLLLALPLIATLYEMARGAANFYENGHVGAFLPSLILLAVFAAAKGFCALGRFGELCVFPLAFLLPLSLLGGGGHGVSLAFGQEDVAACFAAFGGAPVFFSLYLRCAGQSEQSEFAAASSFSPEPVACGVSAVLAAGLVHIFLLFTGAGSVLSSFLFWFIALGRLFAFSLSVGDVLSLPESGRADASKRLAAFAAACTAVWILSARFASVCGAALAVLNVLFPCAVFAVCFLRQSYGKMRV